MYIKIRYGGWPNISDINKIPMFFLGVLLTMVAHAREYCPLSLFYGSVGCGF